MINPVPWFWRVGLVLSLAAACRASDAGENWLPLSPQDQQVREVPGDPGATAILLYYADLIDNRARTEFIYRRIKVLTAGGRTYADVEIPVFPGMKIIDLQARTIHPDGSIVDFTAQPFEKVVVKGRGIKLLAKVFTLPEVEVGSIIEYKYKWQTKELERPEWILEHDLYAVKEHFLLNYPPSWNVSFVVSGSQAKPVQTKGSIELDVQDVARFHAEEQMPPAVNFKAAVRFSLEEDERFKSAVWAMQASRWSSFYNEFIGNHKEIRQEAAAAIGNVTDPEEKLQRLYARAQAVRNLSYERERTGDEEKREQIKPNNKVTDVLKHGYGTREDIATFFVALARAAGFESTVVVVASREQRFFLEDYLHPGQYDSLLAAVRVNGRDRYFDPGTRFCPFGMVRWIYTSTAAVKLQPFGGAFFKSPDSDQEKAVQMRTARLALAPDGSASGTVTITYETGEALEHRLLASKTDEAGRKKEMEDDLKLWLPQSSTVSMASSLGWEQTEEPLVASFNVSIPNYATVAGQRLLLPASVFLAKQKSTFQPAERKYPIYFHYAFSEVDTIIIELPQGFTVEGVPAPQDVNPPFGRYTSASKIVEQKVISSRSLVLRRFLFDPKMYGELKSFFAKVQLGDEGQVAVRSAAGAPAQPAN